MPRTILAFGETLWDLLPSGAKLGGAPFNFAYRINSLGDQGLMISRLGSDELGNKAWDQILSLGMDPRFIQRDDRWPTGTVEITLDENNNPDYFIVPDVAYDHVAITDELLEQASKADAICYGTLSQRSSAARRTLDRILEECADALKLLDINLRKDCFSTEIIASSLERADLLRLNEEEARSLADLFDLPYDGVVAFGERIIKRYGLSYCLVTLGERGAFVLSAEGEKVYEPGYRVKVVDPCGSGDAFTAGCLHRLLHGASLSECCRLGNTLGAIVATQAGATEPIEPNDLDTFLNVEHERTVESTLKQYAQL